MSSEMGKSMPATTGNRWPNGQQITHLFKSYEGRGHSWSVRSPAVKMGRYGQDLVMCGPSILEMETYYS